MKERVEKIYSLLARIAVSGDAVDVMAEVRAELRRLYAEVKEVKNEPA